MNLPPHRWALLLVTLFCGSLMTVIAWLYHHVSVTPPVFHFHP